MESAGRAGPWIQVRRGGIHYPTPLLPSSRLVSADSVWDRVARTSGSRKSAANLTKNARPFLVPAGQLRSVSLGGSATVRPGGPRHFPTWRFHGHNTVFAPESVHFSPRGTTPRGALPIYDNAVFCPQRRFLPKPATSPCRPTSQVTR